MEDKMDISTEYMKVRTRGGASPNGKRRVYFTCHPEDFEKYFDKICDDIFKTQDCAIYYTADMTAPIPEQYLESDLGQMSLFVMPVTFRLLYEQNRAMDSDYAFAISENHLIPVLPLMMETGIDEFYGKRFGKREYYSPYSHDITAISYEEKLKKYLSSILLDDDTVERIRKAFDAYIFLSYRKKDRHHANELMGLIHKNPMYRDVAIWYDEFLTPGEDFEKEIQKALDKSELFTLLVTPNLVNEQNYVQTTEYPYAHEKAQKPILPAEMVETDKEKLKKQYPGVVDCVDAHTEALDAAILEGLKTISLRTNDDYPEHCYLIGLAYLDGIDVEVNRKYAVELITAAAEKEYPEAMEKLFYMYSVSLEKTIKDSVNVQEAERWGQKLVAYYSEKLGESDKKTILWMSELTELYISSSNFSKAHNLGSKLYGVVRDKYGEDHSYTLQALDVLARACCNRQYCGEGLDIGCKSYILHARILGDNDKNTIKSLCTLASLYFANGDNEKAIELYIQVYEHRRKALGEENEETLKTMYSIAEVYERVKKYAEAIEMCKSLYEICSRIYGEEGTMTVKSLLLLRDLYCDIENHDEEYIVLEKQYRSLCSNLGKEHPMAVSLLGLLIEASRKCGNEQKAYELTKELVDCYNEIELKNFDFQIDNGVDLECFKKMAWEMHVYSLTELIRLNEKFGDENSLTAYAESLNLVLEKLNAKSICGHLDALNNSISILIKHKAYCVSEKIQEKIYFSCMEIHNDRSKPTTEALECLIEIYGKNGKFKKAAELYEGLYKIRCETLGREHPDSQDTMAFLILFYLAIPDKPAAENLVKMVCESKYKLGLYLVEAVETYYDLIGQPEKAAEVRARAIKLEQ